MHLWKWQILKPGKLMFQNCLNKMSIIYNAGECNSQTNKFD